eukprot:SAG31_NODE_19747_length_592_cov_2.113590_2_plen_41_part_01
MRTKVRVAAPLGMTDLRDHLLMLTLPARLTNLQLLLLCCAQ